MTENYPKFEYPSQEQDVRDIEAALNMRPEHRTDVEVPLEFETMEEGIARIRAQNEAMRPQREAEERERIEARKRWVRGEKIHKWKRRYKMALATVALASTIKGGGFIDMAMDPFKDAGDVVAADVASQTYTDYIDTEGTVDGIGFSDYSQSAQAKMINDAESKAAKHNAARQTVIDLFTEADKDGYDNIIQTAEAWKQEHADQFLDADRLAAAYQRVDESHSNQEAVNALGSITQFYGIEAEIDASFDGKEDEVKDMAKAYIKVFTNLPRDFIQKAAVKRVRMAESFVQSSDSGMTKAGEYSSGDKSITIIPYSSAAFKAATYLQQWAGDGNVSYESIIAHELGHAFEENGIGIQQIPEGGQTTDVTAAAIGEQVGRHVIGLPEVPSMYSRTSSEEFSAELSSGILSDTPNGLADVNSTREFSSKLNKHELNQLVEYEKAYPGIALLLVANRSR